MTTTSFCKVLPYAEAEVTRKLMDAHLTPRAYFVAERFTIADIALFAYTHVAGEGGFDLSRVPAVQRWIARVEAQPRFVPITEDFGVPASPMP